MSPNSWCVEFRCKCGRAEARGFNTEIAADAWIETLKADPTHAKHGHLRSFKKFHDPSYFSGYVKAIKPLPPE